MVVFLSGGSRPRRRRNAQKKTTKTTEIVVRNARRPRQRTRRARAPRPTALSRHSPAQQSAGRYLAGLCANRICADADVPSVDARPFVERTVRWRVVPNADSNGQVILCWNPHMMWCNSGIIMNNQPSTSQFVPNIWQAKPGTIDPQLTGGDNHIVPIGNSVGAVDNSSVQYAGDVRFLGGECVFTNVATVFNTGGQLHYVHNPENNSFLHTFYNSTAGTLTPQGVSTASTVIAATDSTAFKPVGTEPLHFAILPHTTNFEEMETDYTMTGSVVNAGDAAAAQVAVDPIIPCEVGESRHNGWTQALVYIPAQTIAGGNGAQCIIDFTMHYHLNVKQDGSAWTQTAGVQNTTFTSVDPQAAAAMQAGLAITKIERQKDNNLAIREAGEKPPEGFLQQFADGVAKVWRPALQLAAPVIESLLAPETRLMGGISRLLTDRPRYPALMNGPIRTSRRGRMVIEEA